MSTSVKHLMTSEFGNVFAGCDDLESLYAFCTKHELERSGAQEDDSNTLYWVLRKYGKEVGCVDYNDCYDYFEIEIKAEALL